MSDLHPQWFERDGERTVVFLPFDAAAVIDAWAGVQRSMTREKPDAFTRDEWAYLATFVGQDNLQSVFDRTFGGATRPGGNPDRMVRPRGPIAVWLPNNVSLLGPLTMVLALLTGNAVRVKAGSRADDLATAFARYVHSRNDAVLNAILDRLDIQQFDRNDPRSRAMAVASKVRIVFGSDAAAEAIDKLPHPIDSVGFHFVDRSSEVWLDRDRIDDATLRTLIKVFAIYGQAGCTSPRKAVVIDGTAADAERVRDRMVELWPEVMRRDVDPHIASQNVMASQWAAAVGWSPRVAARNAAVVASGTAELPPIDSFLALPVVPLSLVDAAGSLPANVQTLGHNAADINEWLPRLAQTSIKRVVPIGSMHHFGSVWDGWEWWRQSFEIVEVGR